MLWYMYSICLLISLFNLEKKKTYLQLYVNVTMKEISCQVYYLILNKHTKKTINFSTFPHIKLTGTFLLLPVVIIIFILLMFSLLMFWFLVRKTNTELPPSKCFDIIYGFFGIFSKYKCDIAKSSTKTPWTYQRIKAIGQVIVHRPWQSGLSVSRLHLN